MISFLGLGVAAGAAGFGEDAAAGDVFAPALDGDVPDFVPEAGVVGRAASGLVAPTGLAEVWLIPPEACAGAALEADAGTSALAGRSLLAVREGSVLPGSLA